MLESIYGVHQHVSLSLDKLLVGDEAIAIVDDDAAIREPLKIYLEEQGLSVVEAGTAGEFRNLLTSHNIALVLLDIGLPDADGLDLLPEIVNNHPDQAVVMLTGVADLQVAIECIRNGADDYLSKPVQFQEILFVVRKVLERRRLIFENRKYQEDLEKAHFRIRLLHQLSLKMNTVYLSTVELDAILQAILVGITAGVGLQFNRAFLAMFSEDGRMLEGRFAIGASCREKMGRVWSDLREKRMDLHEIIESVITSNDTRDDCTDVIRSLRIPVADSEHILIRSALERRSILVTDGHADVPVDRELIKQLGENSFVVVPLYSPSRSLGVIIADHFLTRQPITLDLVHTLEVFAGQASLAIEHSHLYMNMQNKIGELEELTNELEKNKDLLVEAERYSALGQMAAQLVHAIRNPVTSIGGAARILAKRAPDETWQEFISMIVKETAKLESTLEDLFDFVSQTETSKEPVPLYPLIKKTVLLMQPTMDRQSVTLHMELSEPGPHVVMDSRQIQQLILHLVKNAIEAMPQGGGLTITAGRGLQHVTVTVQDSGMGMADRNLQKAKDPFFTTKTYGTGLGLTMVERIAREHGGHFTLSRRPEGGMEARVKLPCCVAGTENRES